MDKKQAFFNAKNFVVYYGTGRESELSKFDVAVVEPLGHDKEGIRRLRSSGTLVFAYLSVMEISNTSPDFRLLKDEDFLKVRGKPVTNPEYGTYLMKMDSFRWNNILVHKAGYFLTQFGYDGLFIDTAGDVELHSLPDEVRHEQAAAAANLFARIKSMFPGCLILQNNGLEKLCQYTLDAIDGICWENPPFNRKESDLWCHEILKRLILLKKQQKVRTFFLIVDEAEIDIKTLQYARKDIGFAYKIAVQEGFLLYVAPIHYVGKVNPAIDIL